MFSNSHLCPITFLSYYFSIYRFHHILCISSLHPGGETGSRDVAHRVDCSAAESLVQPLLLGQRVFLGNRILARQRLDEPGMLLDLLDRDPVLRRNDKNVVKEVQNFLRELYPEPQDPCQDRSHPTNQPLAGAALRVF
jgi:hypothetical protein